MRDYMPDWKLLLHSPESDRFELALKLARNFIKVLTEKDFLVRILVNAERITILKHFNEVEDLYYEAIKEGVEVYFCENAMKAFDVTPELIPEKGKTVPAGIKALVEWQNEGYRYVRV